MLTFTVPMGGRAWGADAKNMVPYYFEITPSGQFLFTMDKSEMGQGVITGQLTLFGEEADINPLDFKVQTTPVDEVYGTLAGHREEE